MTPQTIKQILKNHGVPFYQSNGNIYADSMENGTKTFDKVENVTTWTRTQLFAWLGY